MLHSDSRYPGWVQGWGVVEGGKPGGKLAGVFETLREARTAAADAGAGYEVRWGSYHQRDRDLVTARC